MAAQTFTASDQLAQPRACATGINVAKAVYSTSTTISVSDVVLMCKLPFNAVVIDGYVAGHYDSAAARLKVGYLGVNGAGVGSETAFIAELSLSSAASLTRFTNAAGPINIAGSDDAMPRYKYATITMIAVTSLTGTASITMVIEYAMPGAV
jgi:hypothetical protein